MNEREVSLLREQLVELEKDFRVLLSKMKPAEGDSAGEPPGDFAAMVIALLSDIRDRVSKLEASVQELSLRIGEVESLARTVGASSQHGGTLYSNDRAPRGSAFRERADDLRPRSPYGQ